MKFVLATNNSGKLREIRHIMDGYEVVSLKEIGINIDVEENGETFEENALIKAREICKICKLPTIADDSGLCVDFLNGAPGIYTARYAGEDKDNDANIDKLLCVMKDVEEKDRGAAFVSAAAACFPDGLEVVVRGECRGVITTERRGNGGFGYDPVFFADDFGKTFGELTEEQKNTISHRKKAFQKLKEELDKNTKK